jgi:hypothetical protein
MQVLMLVCDSPLPPAGGATSSSLPCCWEGQGQVEEQLPPWQHPCAWCRWAVCLHAVDFAGVVFSHLVSALPTGLMYSCYLHGTL